MKLTQPVVVLRHKNKKFARQMAALLRVEGIRCELEASLVQQQAGKRGELRLLVEAADAERARAMITEHRRGAGNNGQSCRPQRETTRQGRSVEDHRPPVPPHQRSALPSYHRPEQVKTASRRRGHRAASGEEQG
jgi:predicted outer membrane protein